nr:hypothetical protein [Ezakiella coagulans]
MPREGVTIFNLLISCPSDVVKYLDVINESVSNFNNLYGKDNQIRIETLHWSKNSYTESGDRPQKLLNKQLVQDCDFAVAIFWTKFGTPTEKYGSGTEEEIEEMFSAQKQVFMYFLDERVLPSDIDTNQFKRVIDFKKKYREKGLYSTVKDQNDFKNKFTNDLILYFSSEIIVKTNKTNEHINPLLTIRSIDGSGNFSLVTPKLHESTFVDEKKKNILKRIKTLKNSTLHQNNSANFHFSQEFNNRKPCTIKEILESDLENADNISSTSNLILNNEWKRTINDFAKNNNIVIDQNFWNLGDLKNNSSKFGIFYDSMPSQLVGTNEEKERYAMLKEIYSKIKVYDEYNDYFCFIDSIKVLKLKISNIGKTYDEDINIKLIIPKNFLIKQNELPYPGENIIKQIIDLKIIESLFFMRENGTYIEYKNSFATNLNFRRIEYTFLDIFNNTFGNYEMYKNVYNKLLNSIFLYKYFENSDSDILSFDIKYLKQNSSMAFPSVLMFKKNPAIIEYEISSKYISDVIKGIIEIKD